MKKTFSILVVLMAAGSLAFASGSPDNEARIAVVKKGTTYKLYYNGSQQMDVSVSIRDASDRIVFKEVIEAVDGFVRPYNFSRLTEGDYTIEIKDGNGLRTEKIRYEKADETKFANIFKVTGAEHKYLLMISNKAASSFTIRILDGSDNIIYSQMEKIDGDFAKVYNLERFIGKVSFEITDDNGNLKSISY
jgi:hypothetical protein